MTWSLSLRTDSLVVSNFLKTGVKNVFYIVHQHTHILPIPNKFHNTMLILYYLSDILYSILFLIKIDFMTH